MIWLPHKLTMAAPARRGPSLSHDTVEARPVDVQMESHLNPVVNPADPGTVPKFVDSVPRPAVLYPSDKICGMPRYRVAMRQVEQRLHRDFPPTPVWGYEGTYPGPTIEVQRERPVEVEYLNELPEQHLLPVDTTVHGAEPFRPRVRTTVHLHGGNVPPAFDGHPDSWFTPGLAGNGPRFETNRFHYPNRQPATSLWYHDHAVGITRLNIYAGLAGFYLIRDRKEERLSLPAGEFEWPLILHDRSFNPDGSLFYPAQIEPEFFGNTNLVNGKVWPVLEVEPRRYRLRLLNGANARFYRLRFDPALLMVPIGADQGFLDRPATVSELLLSPAERADVIIDFTGLAGSAFTLTNDAPTPFPDGDPVDPHTALVMQVRVSLPLSGPDTSTIPTELPADRPPREKQAVRIRDLTLNETEDEMGRVLPLLGVRDVKGRPLPLTWGDSTTEFPRLGDVEVWRLINLTEDGHPIHLHLVRFWVLDRQPFDVDKMTDGGDLAFTGPPVPAPPGERGPKDTVVALPGEVTRIITRFRGFPGEFVWHCHLLEHEDHVMMRRYVVLGEDGSSGILGCDQ